MLRHPTSRKLENATDRSCQEDRRASARFRANRAVACRRMEDGKDYQGWLRDVSTLGAGLILPQPVKLGTLMELELCARNGSTVATLLARAVHLDEEAAGSWLVGFAFVNELTSAEMKLFRADAVQPERLDHRRWVRFPCNVETACSTCETMPGERRKAKVLNISAGGVGLLLHCEFALGTLLQMDLPPGGPEMEHPLLLRVVRCLEHGHGFWYLGCEFVRVLREDEVRMLTR